MVTATVPPHPSATALRSIDLIRLATKGLEFRHLAERCDEYVDQVALAGRRLATGWAGAAADRAQRECAGLTAELRRASLAANRCDQVLAEFTAQLHHARSLVPESVEAGLRLADAADRQASTDLDAAVRLLATSDQPAPGVRLLLGAGPTATAAWWHRLNADERSWLILHRPEHIGGLDGIPVAERDLANRLVLATRRRELLERRAAMPVDDLPGIWSERDWIDAHLRGLAALEQRLTDPDLPRAYLVALATDQDGRAVIAVGNPDRATDVLTYVPGVGAGLPGVAALIDRADAVAAQARVLAPDRPFASVAWLGYDPPDGPGAVLASAAHQAGPALDRYVDGLRVTHAGAGPAHHTVLGHSYGSLVVGLTSRDHGLAADDLVFVGSPGVGVDRVEGLGRPAGTVWSSTAADDPVQHCAPGPVQLGLTALANLTGPLPASYCDGTPDALLWYGTNPSQASFGARVFASDPDGGHSGYWQGEGLTNITRIALNEPSTESPTVNRAGSDRSPRAGAVG
ncbi:MAG TPA: alpha/beta hydrolase [Micromonosporaceae bacterium]